MESRTLLFQDPFSLNFRIRFLMISGSVLGSVSGFFRGCFSFRPHPENIDFVLLFTVDAGPGLPKVGSRRDSESAPVFGIVFYRFGPPSLSPKRSPKRCSEP